ncbi:helix-turn-helix domain-containing protein [Streptomyces sp. NPDC048623]|uniref:helix-turn-helix domain-containing protein n=1 Tax=Streptomyces sp. NPDC048623 TaxID=3155761 RepID=UPI0034368231
MKIKRSRGFTIIENELIQDRRLSFLARSLSAYIQSLPEGSDVSIRALAAASPEEGHIRIAAALRELEEYGYLERTRVRLPNGRVVTQTTSYNHPDARWMPLDSAAEPERESESEAGLGPAPEPDPGWDPEPDPDSDPDPDPGPPSGGGAPEPVRLPAPEPVRVREATPPETSPEEPPTGPAADLLLGLRSCHPGLLLSVRDVHRLVPLVEDWFDRGCKPDAVRRALTDSLPDPLKYPAGFLRHRLTRLIPPPLPAPPPPLHPYQSCEICERAFRAPERGLCGEWRCLMAEHAA